MTTERCTLGLVKRPLFSATTHDGLKFHAHADCLEVRRKRLQPGTEDTVSGAGWGR